MNKKYLIIFTVVFIVAIFGVFLLKSGNKTFYIKNSAPRLSIASINQKIYQAEDRIGDLSNTIIPKINIPENLTENLAEILAKEIIGKNNEPKNYLESTEQGLNVPNPSKIAEAFITDGLKKANELILNIKQPQLQISSDNSKEAIISYLAEAQKIIKENLKGPMLISILEDINKNNGEGVEKLLPVIAAHETTANQLEENVVPSDLKNLMAEEIRLLRITANVLRPLTNIENDPLATITAIKQFGVVIQGWAELQIKFNNLTQKLNRS